MICSPHVGTAVTFLYAFLELMFVDFTFEAKHQADGSQKKIMGWACLWRLLWIVLRITGNVGWEASSHFAEI